MTFCESLGFAPPSKWVCDLCGVQGVRVYSAHRADRYDAVARGELCFSATYTYPDRRLTLPIINGYARYRA